MCRVRGSSYTISLLWETFVFVTIKSKKSIYFCLHFIGYPDLQERLGNGFLPGHLSYSTYGVLLVREKEAWVLGWRQARSAAVANSKLLETVFWQSLQIRWLPGHQATFSSRYCQDSLWVRLASSLNHVLVLITWNVLP